MNADGDGREQAPTGLARAQELGQLSTEEALTALIALADDAADRGDGALAGRCRYIAARVAVNLGRLDPALALIDRAETELTAAGEHVEATRTGLGRMHVLDDLGRHDEALAVGAGILGRIGELAAHLRGSRDAVRLEAAVHENRGVSNGYLGRHRDALSAYAEAERLYRTAGLEDESVRCAGNRGVELLEFGRADEALELLTSTQRHFIDQPDLLSAAKCAAFAARAQLVLGDHLSAVRAIAESERLLEGQETTTEYARTQLVRAESLAALNLVREAEELYHDLEMAFATGGLEHDRASALAGRARLLLRAGRRRSAAPLFERAEIAFAGVGDRAMEAVCRIGRSFCAEAEAARQLAEDGRDALAELGRGPDEVVALLRLAELSPLGAVDALVARCDGLLAAADVPELRWQVLRHRARLYEWRGDLGGALRTLAEAAGILERLRLTITDERGRIPFLGPRRAVHEDTVDLLLRTEEVASAYRHTCGARARTLVERTSTRRRSGSPEPAHGDAPYGTTSPADGEVIVTYEIAGDEVLVFTDSATGVSVRRAVATVGEVEGLVRRLDAEWRRFDDRTFVARHHEELVASAVRVLRRLHDALLGRVEEAADARSLVIVPIGAIANVPFAALHNGREHVLEASTVSFAASPLPGARCAAARRGGRRLVLGVPDAMAPRIADEVTAIAAMFDDATLLLDGAATTDALAGALATHDVIHLACHGVNRPDNPMMSGLRLADRWLTALEIAQLDLDGQLVVLSACASGRQESLGNHDEMVGLPRAFLAAGAGAVVVNLWRVDDETSRALMTEFHRRLDGQDATVALRDCQLAQRSERPHPFLWSSSVTYRGLQAPH